jgi:hypothetical protein
MELLAAIFAFLFVVAIQKAGAGAGKELAARREREAAKAAREALMTEMAVVEPLLLAPPSEQVERHIYRN